MGGVESDDLVVGLGRTINACLGEISVDAPGNSDPTLLHQTGGPPHAALDPETKRRRRNSLNSLPEIRVAGSCGEAAEDRQLASSSTSELRPPSKHVAAGG